MAEPRWITAAENLSDETVKVATIVLTNDQIQAEPGTPYAIVLAPGDGRIICPLFTVVHANFANSYTNKSGHKLNIGFLNTGGPFVTITQDDYGIFSSGDWTYIVGGPFELAASITPQILDGATANIQNQDLAVWIFGSGALTDGNANNTLKISISYHLADL